MKFIFLVLMLISQLFSFVVQSPIISVNKDESLATVKIKKIDVGMSGFVYHIISQNHGSILKKAVVIDFNKETHIAKLKLTPYDALKNNALPNGKWKIQKGDVAILAFGYSRALLIAPNEEIYYRISRSTNIQWVHPDIFATILSFSGHPTPLLEDFQKMSKMTSTGLIFIYLDRRVYTLDAQSFKILSISNVKLKQDKVNLPFYTRVPKISSSWWDWGDGTGELERYEPHYYSLLVRANPNNKLLLKIVKRRGIKVSTSTNYFNLGIDVDKVLDKAKEYFDINNYVDFGRE